MPRVADFAVPVDDVEAAGNFNAENYMLCRGYGAERYHSCTVEETAGHTHADECFENTLIRTEPEQPAHTHADGCYGTVYFCGKEESQPHTHGESCTETVVVCTLAETEGHSHTAECIQQTLVCTDTSEEHSHTDGCYTENIICGKEESAGHSHTESCSETKLICTLAEGEGHTHSAECCEEQLVCTLAETAGHSHTDACYTASLVCTVEETAGHTHSESCYTAGIGFGCGLLEAGGHVHTAECITEETQLGCGKEITEGHTHGEECLQFTGECLIEEHIHDQSCYSNINADLETSADWEATLTGVVVGAKAADNLVAVAQSQLGYTESELNFEVDENGNRNGITRYGQWYGNPYGDWNTMFVSFCLHYSQLQGIPLASGAETLRIQWESTGLYIPAADTQPEKGNLLFLDKNANGAADAVAIVTAAMDGQITVIEGDLENKVAETVYAADDAAIMGCGVIPEISGIMTLAETETIATAVEYSTALFNGESEFVLYTQSGNNYYAIDGNANAVQIFIDAQGNITSNTADTDSLLWNFSYCGTYDNRDTYYIQNAATGKYLHPYHDSDTNHGAILTGRWESALYPVSGGVRVRGARQNAYAYLQNAAVFTDTNNANSAAVMRFGKTKARYTVWLDGTSGGVRAFGGSPNTRYTFEEGETFSLPTTWQSPTKYGGRLQGWYDVTNSVYYPPGAQVTVTGNMVFYADWVAETYDVGVYNRFTSDTIDTDAFITTRVFDYSYLFNVMSQNADVSVSSSGHSERWSMVQSGNVDYQNAETLDYIFLDWAGGGTLAQPENRNARNNSAGVYEGLWNDTLKEVLFSTENSFNPQTGEGIIGKTYLGTGNHLFQYASDPNHPYYGYYYYDSQLHAASYNQSAQRFYVYDYLSATSDSIGNSSYSDYLPFNSPYANTGGASAGTYSYDGEYDEYTDTTHYRYEIGYSEGGNAMANMAFGTSMDVKFHLPNSPGDRDADGTYGNKDIYGNEMHFEFTGDDDLWVLVDGKLVLDLGGIHGAQNGTINFSTGVVMVNGTQHHTITDIPAGEHIMQIYYLERGSSQSNCAMYFNLAPRYSLNLQKEDVLSRELLHNAEFSVYTDAACTQPAQLWTSETAYNNGEAARNTFVAADGTVDMWGFSSGNTYYIKETASPSEANYSLAKGVIRFAIDKKGIATYDAEMIDETDVAGNVTSTVSNGFTVHSVRIDEANQKAYVIVTNAQNWVQETTTVQAVKFWEDDLDHSDDYVTVYLTVTDSDGTVRRIREMILSEENDWRYIWTNLPKKDADGNIINYGVAESYEEGYYSTSTRVDKIIIDNSVWVEAASFANGEEYLLKTSNGYLATESASSTSLMWVDEATAQSSPRALWTATANGTSVKLTNGVGHTLTFHYPNGQYFYAAAGSADNQTFTAVDSGGGIKLYVPYRSSIRTRNYYIYYMNSNGTLASNTNQNNGMVFTPMTYIESIEEIPVKDLGYQIINTPLEEETSLTVTKQWDAPAVDVTKYHEKQVTVKLLANGTATGRTVTLTLKNNGTDTFRGLPYRDNDGNVIVYTVEEVFSEYGWSVSYGEVVTHSGDPPTYSTTITNTYHPGGPALPSTGSFARLAYIYCGGGIMLASLIAGIRQRRKMERRKQ